MAELTRYPFIDDASIQTLSSTLFKATNTRIKERILTTSSYATDSANATHVLSAQALYAILGNLANYASDDGTGNTFLAKIKALDLAIGETTDTSTDETVYGAIAALGDRISSLTHLTYQVVTGPIETQVPLADAADDVLYLQHDSPRLKIGQNGLVLDENDDVVETTYDSEQLMFFTESDPMEDGTVYAVYYDQGENKYFAATKSGTSYTVTNLEISTAAPFASEADWVEDTTYNLYVCNITESEGVRTAIEWIRVGDTELSLSNYVTKSDYDLKEVQDRILVKMTNQQIINEVQTAFNSTDPYSGDSSYLDAWLPQPSAEDPEEP